MATLTGTGQSGVSNSGKAAHEAVTQARRTLGGRKPQLGFVFCGPDHHLPEVMSAAQAAADGADLLGCSTAGEFTEAGLTHGGIAAFLVASDDIEHRVAF